MLPIVFGSQWDSELARGLAFALGRGYCAVAELEKRKNKTLNIGPLFHLQPSYHASVLRGLVAGGKKLEAAPIMVVQMTAQSEQKARAMSALRLASAGNDILGRVVVVEGEPRGTLITVFIDGQIRESMDVAVPDEEAMVQKMVTSETVCVLFLGDIVDEIGLCWPDIVDGSGTMLKKVPANYLVHRKINTTTIKKGLFRKKETTSSEIDTPFRLLMNVPPDMTVMAFRKIRSESGRLRKPGLGHYFEGPFVLVGAGSVRVVGGEGGYFRFDFSMEKRGDWSTLAPKILHLAAGIETES